MKTPYPKIIVRLPGSVSDVVKALPIFSILRLNYPKGSLTALVEERVADLLRGQDIDHILEFVKEPRFTPALKCGSDVITHLQREEYDIGIVMPSSFSSAYLFYQGMVQRRIGIKRPFCRFLLTDNLDKGDYPSLLEPLGIFRGDWTPNVFGYGQKSNVLKIGIHVKFDEYFTVKWYRQLIDFIIEEIPSVEVILVNHEKDARIKKLIQGEPQVIFKSLNRPLGALIDEIDGLSVLLTDDKDGLAIAKGLHKPHVDLSHVTSRRWFIEDIFYQLKDALLEPLKDTSKMGNYSEYEPIEAGTSGQSDSESKKKVGVIILAGGMGRRLGHDRPKGFLKLGDQTLYDILLEKSKGAEKIGILTSPITYNETADYVKGKGVDLFTKRVYPTECGNGVSPEGNGALFESVVLSPKWDEWKDLDLISVIAIDNPLADPLDPELLSTDKELAVVGVARDKTEEKLGVLCRNHDSLAVREYFTLKKDGLEGLGYAGSFCAKPSFFKRVAGKELPFYRVAKKKQVFFERLVIDGFIYAESFDVIEKDRAKSFFPIKEKSDIFNYCKQFEIEGAK